MHLIRPTAILAKCRLAPPDWDSSDSPAWAIGVVPLVAQHGHPVLVLPRFGNWGSISSLAGSMEPLTEIMSRIAVELSSAVHSRECKGALA